jgi:hypothetical protein
MILHDLPYSRLAVPPKPCRSAAASTVSKKSSYMLYATATERDMALVAHVRQHSTLQRKLDLTYYTTHHAKGEDISRPYKSRVKWNKIYGEADIVRAA